jgi:hypothetical protein
MALAALADAERLCGVRQTLPSDGPYSIAGYAEQVRADFERIAR